MKRCKTCGWWKEGRCDRAKSKHGSPVEEQEAKKAYASDYESYQATFRTAADFGCVAHKPLVSQEG
jgi:hypothetical protein